MIDSVDLRDESNVTVLRTSCEGEHGNKLDEIVHSLELGPHSSAPWSPMHSFSSHPWAPTGPVVSSSGPPQAVYNTSVVAEPNECCGSFEPLFTLSTSVGQSRAYRFSDAKVGIVRGVRACRPDGSCSTHQWDWKNYR